MLGGFLVEGAGFDISSSLVDLHIAVNTQKILDGSKLT